MANSSDSQSEKKKSLRAKLESPKNRNGQKLKTSGRHLVRKSTEGPAGRAVSKISLGSVPIPVKHGGPSFFASQSAQGGPNG